MCHYCIYTVCTLAKQTAGAGAAAHRAALLEQEHARYDPGIHELGRHRWGAEPPAHGLPGPVDRIEGADDAQGPLHAGGRRNHSSKGG